MTPWNRHGIDWTAYDGKEQRRCANGEWYACGFVVCALALAAIGGGLIWWVFQCP